MPPKSARIEEEFQTNETMQDLSETKKELDRVTKALLSVEEDRDMWKRLFEDCNKMQNEEIECLTRKYKERSERLALKTAVERTIPARDTPCGQSPMELLTPRELSQTTEVRVPTAVGRATIPDPSVTIGDPVVEQTVQKFKCAVLTVCTVPMSSRTLRPTGRKHNEKVIRWNNTVKNLASRNAGRMILMDLEHELRAMDQARFTTDGVHFDSIKGQAWMYRVFQERLDELEVELFDTGVLRREETTMSRQFRPFCLLI